MPTRDGLRAKVIDLERHRPGGPRCVCGQEVLEILLAEITAMQDAEAMGQTTPLPPPRCPACGASLPPLSVRWLQKASQLT